MQAALVAVTGSGEAKGARRVVKACVKERPGSCGHVELKKLATLRMLCIRAAVRCRHTLDVSGGAGAHDLVLMKRAQA